MGAAAKKGKRAEGRCEKIEPGSKKDQGKMLFFPRPEKAQGSSPYFFKTPVA
jgi:hypothetical protein